jgi:hypothetical protein
MNALCYNGGNGIEGAQRILLRAASAAYLNEMEFGCNYPAASTGWLVEGICYTLFCGNREFILYVASILDAWNNIG